MGLKTFLGIAATLMALVAYVPYFRNMLAGRTRPHAFTWLVWASLTAIAFAGQVVEGGGPGAWVTGFTAAVSFVIFGYALWQGRGTQRDIVLVDWLSLAGAALALVLWGVTDNPLTAVLLITVIDALAFVPTFRKSYRRPWEETAVTYSLSGLKFVIAIFALEQLTPTTWLYPASLVLMNGLFVGMLLVRRRQLQVPMPVAGT